MTNYNERLDEILDNVLIGMYCTNPDGDFVPLDDSKNVLRAEAKQAIASLIKELVAEARKQGALDVIAQFKADRINHTLSTSAADWERELETADKTLERYIADLSKESR